MPKPRLQADGRLTSTSSHAPLRAGDCLQGRYTVVRVRHIGGLSALYEALDQKASPPLNRRAIKETLLDNADVSSASQAADQFMRRASLFASLDHPAIPKTLDYFVLHDRTYLVMEYVEGEDLEDILNDPDRDLTVAEIVRWAIELGEVLDYLHSRQPAPIIYRDIKPSNIMIDAQGRVRLVDFGIADQFLYPQTDSPLGTDGYAAPEQYEGWVSPAIDIYAFGAMLHHLLTRRDPRLEPPFSFEAVPIRDMNPLVPPELEVIVMRALAYAPEERFASIADMLEALRQVRLNETDYDS